MGPIDSGLVENGQHVFAQPVQRVVPARRARTPMPPGIGGNDPEAARQRLACGSHMPWSHPSECSSSTAGASDGPDTTARSVTPSSASASRIMRYPPGPRARRRPCVSLSPMSNPTCAPSRFVCIRRASISRASMTGSIARIPNRAQCRTAQPAPALRLASRPARARAAAAYRRGWWPRGRAHGARPTPPPGIRSDCACAPWRRSRRAPPPGALALRRPRPVPAAPHRTLSCPPRPRRSPTPSRYPQPRPAAHARGAAGRRAQAARP